MVMFGVRFRVSYRFRVGVWVRFRVRTLERVLGGVLLPRGVIVRGINDRR